MNKVILMGRTTKEPEIRYSNTKDGQMCCARFTLAVEDRSYKLEDGKYYTDFIDCYTVGKLAEVIEKTVSKGQQLCLSGKWRTSSYVDKENKKHYTQNMLIQEIFLCGKKNDSSQNSDNSNADVEYYSNQRDYSRQFNITRG